MAGDEGLDGGREPGVGEERPTSSPTIVGLRTRRRRTPPRRCSPRRCVRRALGRRGGRDPAPDRRRPDSRLPGRAASRRSASRATRSAAAGTVAAPMVGSPPGSRLPACSGAPARVPSAPFPPRTLPFPLADQVSPWSAATARAMASASSSATWAARSPIGEEPDRRTHPPLSTSARPSACRSSCAPVRRARSSASDRAWLPQVGAVGFGEVVDIHDGVLEDQPREIRWRDAARRWSRLADRSPASIDRHRVTRAGRPGAARRPGAQRRGRRRRGLRRRRGPSARRSFEVIHAVAAPRALRGAAPRRRRPGGAGTRRDRSPAPRRRPPGGAARRRAR